MRIVIVTAPHMIFAPMVLTPLVRQRAAEIAGVVLISPPAGALARGVIQQAGLRYFLAKSLDHLSTRLSTRLNSEYAAIRTLVQDLGIRCIETQNVNSAETLRQIRSLEPEVVLSAFAPQIFKRELIGLASQACINVHPSLLPKYAGVAPVFWCLANGEDETGVTIHHIAAKVDAGDVFLQATVPIAAADTVRVLYTRVCREAARLLLEAFDRIEAGRIVYQKQDLETRSRFGNPTRDAYRRLRARGRRLF